jgi:hypothetical protein
MVPRSITLLAFALLLCGCNAGRSGTAAIGEAFVGPSSLNLRQELAPKSPVVATVKHGDRLEVVQTRRRFVKVRAQNGAIGWTDSRQLLSTEEMDELKSLAEESAKLPSQGAATVYESLNVHTDASRTSPSFAQIVEKDMVDVVGHRLAPRHAPPRNTTLVPTPPPQPVRKKKKSPESKKIPPPPMPAPPPLPPNWLELSKSAKPAPGAEEEFAREAAAEGRRDKEDPVDKPVPMEDWSLVRLKDGRTGWVLSRMLIMAIPDEVAQYAEGHRITSYFALADVQDGDQTKHHWLWTTMSRLAQPYEFDGFRVFIWNLRRHRYETAYIERNVKGYYPVLARKGKGDRGEGATFAVLLETADGQFIEKKFAFNGYRVSLVSKTPHAPPERDQDGDGAQSVAAGQRSAAPADSGFIDSLKNRAKSILK